MVRTILFILVLLLSCTSSPENNVAQKMQDVSFLFVGTYTRTEGHVDGKGKGIHILQWSAADQSLDPYMIIEGPTNPSYITLHPSLPIVYTVNEVADNTDAVIGTVAAYRYDLQKKSSKKISETSSIGDAPCHISLSGDLNHLLVANYVGGSIATFDLSENGEIIDVMDSFINEKLTPATPRQESGHAHMIQSVPNSDKILVADLGTDEIISFKIDNNGKLIKQKAMITEPNAGPRHFDFHPKIDMLYVLNELSPSISVFRIQDGLPLEKIQQLKIPIRQEGDAVYSSAIKAHPSGNMIYAATRGLNGSTQNEIVAAMVLEDGRLHILQTISTQGNVPRDFTITPDGKFLIVGNQDTDEIVIFEINQNTYGLTMIRKDQSVPTPVCFQWTNAII